MRLCSLAVDGTEVAAVSVPGRGVVPLSSVDPSAPASLLDVLTEGLEAERVAAWNRTAEGLPGDAWQDPSQIRYAPLYRRPRKLWGIGLNYRDHATDLGASFPTAPASFMKGDHTIIGPGDPIVLPPQSHRVTAEAELGLVIGRPCWRVDEADALSCLAGVVPVLDQTAEDILQENPRFLTRAKNFPTFFSFGPELVMMDEVIGRFGSIEEVVVATWHNGALHRENRVGNMMFPPAHLVSFHSHVMPLYPGDIISSGTPGAAVLADGDVAECRIEGIGTLTNPARSG